MLVLKTIKMARPVKQLFFSCHFHMEGVEKNEQTVKLELSRTKTIIKTNERQKI